MDRTMKILLNLCLSTVMTLACVNLASAGTYKWVDKDGTVHYSQQPPAQGNYQRLKIHTERPSSDSSSGSSTPNYTTPSSNDDKASDVIKQTEAKGEEQRKKNCATAKKALQTYTVYRRVRDKDGNVIRLDDKERAKRINDAKAAIKEFCQ